MKFEPQYKTQGEFYGEMARVYKMCEGTEVRSEDGLKINRFIYNNPPRFTNAPTEHEFSIGIVEGKHVFRGDTLYYEDLPVKAGASHIPLELCSWNPPKQESIIPEGFTPWHGGKWAGRPNDVVKVQLRDGTINVFEKEAQYWHWYQNSSSFDIIAYKITKKQEPETVLVEFESMGDLKRVLCCLEKYEVSYAIERAKRACRKALEKENLL